MPTVRKTSDKAADKPVKPAATAKKSLSATTASKTVKSKAAKPAEKGATKKPAATPKTPAPQKKAVKAVSGKMANLTAEQRRYYVEVAAYYIAERRGFHGGSQVDDWVQAEAEIERLLREGILKP